MAKLAQLLQVSQVTTRKDLDQLEAKGLIKPVSYTHLRDFGSGFAVRLVVVSIGI